MQIYIRLGEKLHGPFSPEQINKLGHEGRIDQNTQMCLQANGAPDGNWLPAFVRGFAFQSGQSTPPPAAATPHAETNIRSPESLAAPPIVNHPPQSVHYPAQDMHSVGKLPSQKKAPTPEWHYIDQQGQKNGPHSDDTLNQLFSTGVLNLETLVWCEGMDNWTTAKNVEGFARKVTMQTAPVPGEINSILENPVQAISKGSSLDSPTLSDKTETLKKKRDALILIGGGIAVALLIIFIQSIRFLHLSSAMDDIWENVMSNHIIFDNECGNVTDRKGEEDWFYCLHTKQAIAPATIAGVFTSIIGGAIFAILIWRDHFQIARLRRLKLKQSICSLLLLTVIGFVLGSLIRNFNEQEFYSWVQGRKEVILNEFDDQIEIAGAAQKQGVLTVKHVNRLWCLGRALDNNRSHYDHVTHASKDIERIAPRVRAIIGAEGLSLGSEQFFKKYGDHGLDLLSAGGHGGDGYGAMVEPMDLEWYFENCTK